MTLIGVRESAPTRPLPTPCAMNSATAAYAVWAVAYRKYRTMGAIELANPTDGAPFTDQEARALDYVCERFGEFLSGRPLDLRPVVVDGR